MKISTRGKSRLLRIARDFSMLMFLFCVLGPVARAQPNAVICPPNIDFNSGNFSNWNCYTGSCCPINTPTNSGPVLTRHTITSGVGVDPIGGFPVVAPGGGTYSVRVGNDQTGAQAERIEYNVVVPVGFNNYSFNFLYAIVLQDPGHPITDQPRFEVKAFNQATGAPILCATLNYIAGAGLPGFQNGTNGTVYLPWTSGSLNLSGQGGNTITIQVSSGDCGQGGHFGYGYFDVLSCGQFQAAVANCNLDSNKVTFSGPPGYASYVWRDSANTFTYGTGPNLTLPTPPVGDSLWCKVILTPFNSNGCPDTVKTPVIRNFKIHATPDTLCNSLGNPVPLNVAITAGNPGPPYPYHYKWSPAATLSNDTIPNPIATPQTTGFYYVKVTDSVGCFRKDTLYVQNPHFTLTTGPDIVTCIGTPVTIPTVVTPSTGNYTYTWTPTTNLSSGTVKNPVFTPVAVGSQQYILRVDSAICARQDTINVRTLPNTFFVTDTTVCAGVTFKPSVSGDAMFTYTWTPNINLSANNVIRPFVTSDTTRTYTITANYPTCPNILKPFHITVEPNPLVNLGPDVTKCKYTDIYFSANVQPSWFTQYQYNWTANANINNTNTPNIVFNGQTDTTLVLTVNTPIGCVGKDSVHVHVYNSHFSSISPADTAVCPRDSVLLKLSGGKYYQWIPSIYLSSDTASLVLSHPITTQGYTIYVVDSNGCRDTTHTIIRVNPEAVLSLPDSVTLYPDESFQMDPQGNCLYFSWFPPQGLSNPNIANPKATPDVNTRYFVSASTEGGCSIRDSIDVMVRDESALDVPNAFSPGSNPNSTIKVVRRGSATLKSFRIYDRWGTKVFESSNIDEGWNGTFNGTPQPMGVYIYAVEAYTKKGTRFYKQGNITLLR